MSALNHRLGRRLALCVAFVVFTAGPAIAQFAQQGPKLVGSGAGGIARLGNSVSLSADGNTAIVGSDYQFNGRGVAWVWTRSGDVWTVGPTLFDVNAVANARQGFSVSIAADGATAIVGGPGDNFGTGAAWVWRLNGAAWILQAKLVGSGAAGTAAQGTSVSLSSDGNTAVVGGRWDNGGAGAAWVWTRSGNIWTQQGPKLIGSGAAGNAQQGYSVSLSADGNTAVVGGFDDNTGVGAVWVWTRTGGVWTQQGLKLVGSGAVGFPNQGASVSLSADGNTALVGGSFDNGSAGAAWVWTRNAGVWTQQGAKLAGAGAVGNAQQGYSVSVSADGDTAIVGGSSDTNTAGAAWVWTRSGGVWTQQGTKLVGSGTAGNASQGRSVSLSSDGSTAVVGGPLDDTSKGAVWAWTRSGGTWTQQGPKLVGSGTEGGANQGDSVSLSADGNTAIVGGQNNLNGAGAAWVWTRSGGAWTQGQKLVGSGAVGQAYQGASVSMSADGNTALVGGYRDNDFAGAAWVWTRSGGVWTQEGPKLSGSGAVGSAQQGISVSLSSDGNAAIVGGHSDNNWDGAAWVWTRSGGVWTQQGPKLVGSGATGNAQQGLSVSLSADGNTAIVGGGYDNSAAGAAWVWTRSGGTWTQQGAKLAASACRFLGWSISLSGDGNTALVGARGSGNYAGAACVWTRTGGLWTQQGGALVGSGAVGTAEQGRSVSISSDGNTAVVGGPYDNGYVGAAWLWKRSGGLWTQLGLKLVGSGAVGQANRGDSVALSADASTAIVGGSNDDFGAGAAWVFAALPGALNKTAPANGATGQSTSPTLSWGTSSGAASYEYCIDTSNNSACNASWITTGTNTSVGLSGLAPGTAHYWHVRAIGPGGTTYANGSATAFWSFTTMAAPGAFGKAAPVNGATGQPTSRTLFWGTSSGAASYEYCIDTTNNDACDASWTSTGTNTSVVLSGLAAGTAHYWHVRAVSGVGTTYAEGNATSFWSFTTLATPGAFGHTSPGNGSTGQSTSPTLSWGTSTMATSYEYCIDTSSNSACSPSWISTGANTATELSGLAPDITYYWHVRAIGPGGTTYADGSATAFWSFTTAPLPPGAFSKTTPTTGATGQPTSPTLSWGASSGAASYEYCYDTNNDNACDASWLSVGNATTVGLSGLSTTTTYYWHVRSVNGGGTTYAEADATAFWSFTTGTLAPAFGQVDTPTQNATGVQGAIGVTGWALDDTGVSTVQIYRNCLAFEPANCQDVLGNSVVYIGDAAFLAGARPDVAAAFPTYPNNTRAGWGYLMLTPMLPHVPSSQPFGGQGPLTLYVVATDTNANKTLLGRTFVSGDAGFNTPTMFSMANDTIAKPFGAIDTPGQGQTIAGVFNNFGWAITPDTNTVADGTDILIPTNGSTMTVFIDGLPVSLVAYNQCRGNVGNPPPAGVYCNDDVSNIFGNPTPQAPLTTRTSNPTKFRNLDAARGAIGAYTFDTTTLSDGLHTIAWSVSDSAGRNEGIGSRFFNVLNGAPGAFAGPLVEDALRSAPAQVLGLLASLDHHAPGTDGVWGRTGFDLTTPWTQMHAKDDRTFAVRLPELGRLELWLGSPVDAGYLVADDTLLPLPVGSSLVGAQFAWMPPAGYAGAYTLAFIRGGERITVTVTVVPTTRVIDGEAQIRMGLTATPHFSEVRLEGFAFDPQAAIGSGVEAVHVWATRVEVGVQGSIGPGVQASPVFIGSASLDQAAFSLTTSLAPGTYTLTAYAWNRRTERWEDSRTVQVIVR